MNKTEDSLAQSLSMNASGHTGVENFDFEDPSWLSACAEACILEEKKRVNDNKPSVRSEGGNRPHPFTRNGSGVIQATPDARSISPIRLHTRSLPTTSSTEYARVIQTPVLRGYSKISVGPSYVPGVGIQPDAGLVHDHQPDPCWRCGEPTELVRKIGCRNRWLCSGRPFCPTVRFSPKNEVIVELTLKEDAFSTDPLDRSRIPCMAPVAAVREDDYEGSGCFVRCALVVSIRSAPSEEKARNACMRLKDRFKQYMGGVHIEGNYAGSGQGAMVNWLGIVAVLRVEKRDWVKGALKKEGFIFRDVPPSTYAHLAGCAHRSLGPLDACEGALYTLPRDLRCTLLPFQKEGVLYGLRRQGRCLIADEMGTGKTLQALAIMGCYREDWPLLIVVPASMRLMWAEEVERWYPFLRQDQLHLIQGSKDKLYGEGESSRVLGPQVVITSYAMLRNLSSSVGSWTWNAVIFDESHTITTKLVSGQPLQVKTCLSVASKAKRVVMLSGTPSLSKPFDMFNQVDALVPGLLGAGSSAKIQFISNYCDGCKRLQQTKGGSLKVVPFYSGIEYPDELHALLRSAVMVRRLKINVMDQLPRLRQVRTVVRVAENREELRRAAFLTSFACHHYTTGVPESEKVNANPEDGNRMSADRIAGLKKVRSAADWVVDKLESSAETKTKFVVYAHHLDVLDALQAAFVLHSARNSGHGFSGDREFVCLRIDGSVPSVDRVRFLHEFESSTACRVLLVSITAGGQGLDFTAAHNAVFVELPPTPGWLRQAEDRLHRRGQRSSVNVYITVLPPGSHDDKRWLHLSEKLTTLTSVTNSAAAAEYIDVDQIIDAERLSDDD
ncbi:unnamed protein product, partial [Choristocarpus tenellus]